MNAPVPLHSTQSPTPAVPPACTCAGLWGQGWTDETRRSGEGLRRACTGGCLWCSPAQRARTTGTKERGSNLTSWPYATCLAGHEGLAGVHLPW